MTRACVAGYGSERRLKIGSLHYLNCSAGYPSSASSALRYVPSARRSPPRALRSALQKWGPLRPLHPPRQHPRRRPIPRHRGTPGRGPSRHRRCIHLVRRKVGKSKCEKNTNALLKRVRAPGASSPVRRFCLATAPAAGRSEHVLRVTKLGTQGANKKKYMNKYNSRKPVALATAPRLCCRKRSRSGSAAAPRCNIARCRNDVVCRKNRASAATGSPLAGPASLREKPFDPLSMVPSPDILAQPAYRKCFFRTHSPFLKNRSVES